MVTQHVENRSTVYGEGTIDVNTQKLLTLLQYVNDGIPLRCHLYPSFYAYCIDSQISGNKQIHRQTDRQTDRHTDQTTITLQRMHQGLVIVFTTPAARSKPLYLTVKPSSQYVDGAALRR